MADQAQAEDLLKATPKLRVYLCVGMYLATYDPLNNPRGHGRLWYKGLDEVSHVMCFDTVHAHIASEHPWVELADSEVPPRLLELLADASRADAAREAKARELDKYRLGNLT